MKVYESNSPIFQNLFLVLDAKNEQDYQLIYPSQLYGTFFTVSAKITLSKSKKKVTGIDISLVNYKGMYNIGLENSTKNNFSFENGTGILTLDLKAYSGIDDKSLTNGISLILKEEIPLQKFHRIFTTRKLKSFSKSGTIVGHLDEGLFDSEFYVRNGKYIAAINRLDDKLPNTPPADFNIKAGDMCMTSTIKIVNSN
ncbi:hypothetical protein [Croceitalea sp. P059]|uniref:hypothetical protein n=1 Tax=Croceitalea sp. P059 TaxID=3075601 RepID=UPI0028867160|nr:hypothetical protein [Croceitalea sp. P059]MDT0538859.1 hypothetical protein [Croceitalea sp. P059]